MNNFKMDRIYDIIENSRAIKKQKGEWILF